MKIKIMCEKCNIEVELVPETIGNVSYIHEHLKNNDFQLYESEVDKEISSDPYDDFIEKLVYAKRKEQVVNILNDEVEHNVEVDSKLKSVRIDCHNCGDYIVLQE